MTPEDNNDLEIKAVNQDQTPSQTPPETNSEIQNNTPTETTPDDSKKSFQLEDLKATSEKPEESIPTANNETPPTTKTEVIQTVSPEKSFKKYLLSAIIAIIFITGIFLVYKYGFDNNNEEPLTKVDNQELRQEKADNTDSETSKEPEEKSEEMEELEEVVDEIKEQLEENDSEETIDEYIEDLEESIDEEASSPPGISINIPSNDESTEEEAPKITR